MNKIHFSLDGVEYFDYTLLRYVNRRSKIVPDYTYINSPIYDKYVKGSYFDSSFKPARDSEINVIPKCAICVDDIRHSYKIKRGYDNTTCNVFPKDMPYPFRILSHHCLVIHDMKVVISVEVFGLSKPSDADVIEHFFDNSTNTTYIRTDLLSLIALPDYEAYDCLIKGTLKKPAITYSNLEINNFVDPTFDDFVLLYTIGNKNCNFNNPNGVDITFCTEVAAFNQLNWRKYIHTANLVLNVLKHRYNAFGCVYKSISRYPKNVKIFIKTALEDNIYSSEITDSDDLAMYQNMLKYFLDIQKDTVFCSFYDIRDKLSEHHIATRLFTKGFDCVVRVKPKCIKEDQ